MIKLHTKPKWKAFEVFMRKADLDRIANLKAFWYRKGCQQPIAAGEVSLAGACITNPRAIFETDGLEFTVYGESWTYREHVYYRAETSRPILNVPGSPATTPAC